MKANEFVNRFGWEKAKEFSKITVRGLSQEYCFEINTGESIGLAYVNLKDLKRLVESHELVEKFGGLESCKSKLSVRAKFKPNAEYFAVHPIKAELIQMYARNEAKLVPNYRFHDLILAIADVESCGAKS